MNKLPCRFCDASSVATLYHDGRRIRVCEECAVVLSVGFYAAGKNVSIRYGRSLLRVERPMVCPGLNRAERRKRAQCRD